MNQYYTCQCMPQPHTSHVVRLAGRMRCSLCLDEATLVNAPDDVDEVSDDEIERLSEVRL
jgi:hypothetical protein